MIEQELKALEETRQREREPWMRFHWQNLNDRKDGSHGSGWRHGRCWWHFRHAYHEGKTIRFCWNFWTHFCGFSADIRDESLDLHVAFPPVALWLSFGTKFWPLSLWPKRPLSENYPTTLVIDEREAGVAIHNGRVWIKPWVRRDEWRKADPWWGRGISFSINPLEPVHQRHEVRRADGSWVPYVGSRESGKEPDGREEFTYPYTYVLKNGTVQNRTATVYVERRAWRPRCLQWTSLFEKERQSIDVHFDEEVGERTGSWKGGCIGCGYDLLPGETALDSLRRMEKERKF